MAQVGISSTSITPHSSSILELRSTTLGFLPPRMTTTERDAIASPANGLVIYNTTTNLLNFYNGSSWQITGGGNVSSVSVTTANGISGTVTNASTTPAISLTLGAITPTSVTATGTITGSNLSGTNTGDQINITGNAATVTTNANLTGEVTSVGNTTTVTNASVIGKVLTGYVSGAGAITATDNILQAIQKLNGNNATNANLTGPITSVGNITSIASQTGTGTTFVMNTSPALITPNLGTPSAGVATNLTGTASGLTAGNVTTNANLTGMVTSVGNTTTVVTNANLTGEVTSVGNATTVTNASVLGKVLTGYVSGAGAITATDNILQAIQKLNGNNATNANLTGPITSVGNITSIASQTGTGTTFVMNTSPTLITPNLGTPSAGVATNLTGTASGLTAGNVTTNANLTGEVTSVGNATTVANATVIGKVLTGYVSGAGVISATDNILQAIQKLNGNNATNANLTGPITSVGNATSIASQTGIGTTFVMNTSPTLITPNLGTPSAGVATNLTGTASGLTAGNVTTNANLTGMVTSVGNTTTVVTNANLTGEVTSVGNATTVPNATVIGKVLTGYVSGAGAITATDNILQAIQKLDGNNATNANLTGPITSVGNTTGITSQTGTGTTFVMNTSPTLITPNLGTPSAGVATNLTGTASGLTAGNVTTNANLTGDLTSVGNATTIGSGKVTNSMLAGSIDLTTKVTNTLPVANGGTGQTTALVQGGVVYGSSTTSQGISAVGSTGQILRSAGTGTPTWSTSTYPATAGTAGNTLRSDGTNFVSSAVNQGQFAPSNPTGTTNTVALVMMGLGSTATVTPATSGKLLIIISGNIFNNGINNGAKLRLMTGTGTAPTNGAALIGTAGGGIITITKAYAASALYPFSTQAIVTGLTVGTAVWIDLAVGAITGGTGTVNNLSISVVEL